MSDIVSQIYDQIFKIWRPGRMKRFIALVNPRANETVLDVGGCPGFWAGAGLEINRIDALNTYPQPDALDQTPPVKAMIGDGCNLPFPNGAYDIAFSNSVIEHVGDLAAQRRFADEIRRVGQRLWVQTPAFAFPIEPHCLMPFVHWIPWWKLRRLVLVVSPVKILRKGDNADFYEGMRTTRILTKAEFQSLFPDCKILTERFMGLPKCYIAYRLN